MKIIILLVCLFFIQRIPASESIGFYSSGSLKDAKSFSSEANFIHKLFLQRGRFYSHDEIFIVLRDMEQFLQASSEKEKLQVGDFSMEKGGTAPGHKSHQNGLDVDIVYLTKNKKLQNPNAAYWEEEFVANDKVTSNFDSDRNYDLFSFLVQNAPVTRIFVDKAVKVSMCAIAKKRGQINDQNTIRMLSLLVIENLHKTHFHLRLSCPSQDKKCTPQSLPSLDSGCDFFSLEIDNSEEVGC
jgi:penicillin-insensitive murein endopeptidase